MTVAVVCAIIERDGRILACRRATGQTNAGLWEFPGGKVTAGESPCDALVRELREELGIGALPHTALTPVQHTYPWMTIELLPFVCSPGLDEPQAREHAEIRWIDKNDAQGLDWAPADMPVVEEYYRYGR